MDQTQANSALASILDAYPVFLTDEYLSNYLRMVCVKQKGVPSTVYDIAWDAYLDAHPGINALPHWRNPETLEQRYKADLTGLLQGLIFNDPSGITEKNILEDATGTLQAILTVNFGDSLLRQVIAKDELGVVSHALSTMELNSLELSKVLNAFGYSSPVNLPSPKSVEDMRVVQGFLPIPDGFKVEGGRVVAI